MGSEITHPAGQARLLTYRYLTNDRGEVMLIFKADTGYSLKLAQIFLILSPVVWRKAHANDVTVDINNMVQGIKKLI